MVLKPFTKREERSWISWTVACLSLLLTGGFLFLATLGCEVEFQLPEDIDDPLIAFWTFRVSTCGGQSVGPGPNDICPVELIWGYTGRALACTWSASSYDRTLVKAVTLSPESEPNKAYLRVEMADYETLYGPGAIWSTSDNGSTQVGVTARFKDPVFSSIVEEDVYTSRTGYVSLHTTLPYMNVRITEFRPSYDEKGILAAATWKGIVEMLNAPPGWEFEFSFTESDVTSYTPQADGRSATFTGEDSNISVANPSPDSLWPVGGLRVSAYIKGSSSKHNFWKNLIIAFVPTMKGGG